MPGRPRTCFLFKPKNLDGLWDTIPTTPKGTWCTSREAKGQLNTTHIPSALHGNQCVRRTRACSRARTGANGAFGETFCRNGKTGSEALRRYQVEISSASGPSALITWPINIAALKRPYPSVTLPIIMLTGRLRYAMASFARECLMRDAFTSLLQDCITRERWCNRRQRSLILSAAAVCMTAF